MPFISLILQIVIEPSWRSVAQARQVPRAPTVEPARANRSPAPRQ